MFTSKRNNRRALPLLLALAAAGTAFAETALPAFDLSAERILARTKALASDEFEGRAPGTAGEEKTIAYLIDQFRQLGLQPGNPDGTYVQRVPLVGITSRPDLHFSVGDRTIDPVLVNDYIALSRRLTPTVDVKDSELVFVGYGVVAPEFGWDDYKGVDVRGKTVVMLINDPPVADPHDPAKLDENVFRGRAMTYYGRWTYKYEIASEKGAAACLIIHETGPAGYPFAVVSGSWGRENFDLHAPDGNRSRVALEGWLTLDAAKALLAATGHDFAALKAAAARHDFQPVTLGGTASFTVQNSLREVASRNVVGLLPGRDPARRNEYVIYTAHWDHLGRDPRVPGDQIFNGAADNASGTATLLEIAYGLTHLPTELRPQRSILFLSVTAEEKGLLGARYYAENPLYPLNHTLANINLDGANPHGPTRDVEVIGAGASTLEDIGSAVAAAQGRTVRPDAEPEKGYYYRSDHFEFAKVGVPAYYPKSGIDFIGQPAGYGEKLRAAYIAHDYHKVTDEMKPDWTFAGAAQDAAFMLEVGRRVANADTWPTWYATSEFKARRDASLKK